jgi:Fur family zinc uptake transcriptional regulator
MAHTHAVPKLSPHNRKVLDLLLQAEQPLSAYDILDKLHRHGIKAPPTVYRALDFLVKHGLAHKLETAGGFVACRHHGDEHEDDDHLRQFVLCTRCGDVREIEDKSLLKITKKLGEKFLARVSKEVFELSGICHACAKKA